jgi:hypothetical protein
MSRARPGPLVLAAWLAAGAFFSPVRIGLSPPFLEAETAGARPGGGSSFRGGSSSSNSGSSSSRSGSSSSGSGSRSSSSSSQGSPPGFSYGSPSSGSGHPNIDDDVATSLMRWLLFSRFGGLSFFGLIAFVIAMNILKRRSGGGLDWNAGIADQAAPRQRVRPLLEKVREGDPNFSLVLFEDFLYALYAQAHTLRGGQRLGQLSGYMKPAAASWLAGAGEVREVRSIVIGAMRFLSVSGVTDDAAGDDADITVGVEFESNYTEVAPSGAEQSFYADERWFLSRKKGTLSRTPDRTRVFKCPSCGAPLEGMDGGRCSYCQAAVDTGRFDWVVQGIQIVSREPRGPLLTGDTEEQGTDLPTVADPGIQSRFGELCQRDPQFSWPAFQAKVGLIFGAMQSSWSNRDWTHARPFVSDNLFQMLAYWIETYRRAQLRNVTENARIEGLELVRVSTDKFFDAITIRLHASSLDYTITDDGGRIVAGSRSRVRRYSEYWTLIRGAGRTGAARSDAVCPSCGAPLKIEMAGECAYCRARVTSGEFDWVLSRIEQDEVYEG